MLHSYNGLIWPHSQQLWLRSAIITRYSRGYMQLGILSCLKDVFIFLNGIPSLSYLLGSFHLYTQISLFSSCKNGGLMITKLKSKPTVRVILHTFCSTYELLFKTTNSYNFLWELQEGGAVRVPLSSGTPTGIFLFFLWATHALLTHPPSLKVITIFKWTPDPLKSQGWRGFGLASPEAAMGEGMRERWTDEPMGQKKVTREKMGVWEALFLWLRPEDREHIFPRWTTSIPLDKWRLIRSVQLLQRH